jgi:hypothetical protein
MCSAKAKPLGLRTKLTLWSSLVLAASLAAGFLWVHFGLRRVLDLNQACFLVRLGEFGEKARKPRKFLE